MEQPRWVSPAPGHRRTPAVEGGSAPPPLSAGSPEPPTLPRTSPRVPAPTHVLHPHPPHPTPAGVTESDAGWMVGGRGLEVRPRSRSPEAASPTRAGPTAVYVDVDEVVMGAAEAMLFASPGSVRGVGEGGAGCGSGSPCPPTAVAAAAAAVATPVGTVRPAHPLRQLLGTSESGGGVGGEGGGSLAPASTTTTATAATAAASAMRQPLWKRPYGARATAHGPDTIGRHHDLKAFLNTSLVRPVHRFRSGGGGGSGSVSGLPSPTTSAFTTSSVAPATRVRPSPRGGSRSTPGLPSAMHAIGGGTGSGLLMTPSEYSFPSAMVGAGVGGGSGMWPGTSLARWHGPAATATPEEATGPSGNAAAGATAGAGAGGSSAGMAVPAKEAVVRRARQAMAGRARPASGVAGAAGPTTVLTYRAEPPAPPPPPPPPPGDARRLSDPSQSIPEAAATHGPGWRPPTAGDGSGTATVASVSSPSPDPQPMMGSIAEALAMVAGQSDPARSAPSLSLSASPPTSAAPPGLHRPLGVFGLFGMLERYAKLNEFSALFQAKSRVLRPFLDAVAVELHAMCPDRRVTRPYDVLHHLLANREARAGVGEELLNDPILAWPLHMLYLVCCFRVTANRHGHDKLFAAMRDTGGIMTMGKGVYAALAVAMSPRELMLPRSTARMFLASVYVGIVMHRKQEELQVGVRELSRNSFALLLVNIPIFSLRALMEQVNKGRQCREGHASGLYMSGFGGYDPHAAPSVSTSSSGGRRAASPGIATWSTRTSPALSGEHSRAALPPSARATPVLSIPPKAADPRPPPRARPHSEMEVSRIISTRSAVVCGHPLDLLRLDMVLTRFADVNGVKIEKEYTPAQAPENSHHYNRDMVSDILGYWDRAGIRFEDAELGLTVFSPVTGEPMNLDVAVLARTVAEATTFENQDLTCSLQHLHDGDVLLDFSTHDLPIGPIIDWGKKRVSVLAAPGDRLEFAALGTPKRSQAAANMREVLRRLSIIYNILRELAARGGAPVPPILIDLSTSFVELGILRPSDAESARAAGLWARPQPPPSARAGERTRGPTLPGGPAPVKPEGGGRGRSGAGGPSSDGSAATPRGSPREPVGSEVGSEAPVPGMSSYPSRAGWRSFRSQASMSPGTSALQVGAGPGPACASSGASNGASLSGLHLAPSAAVGSGSACGSNGQGVGGGTVQDYSAGPAVPEPRQPPAAWRLSGESGVVPLPRVPVAAGAAAAPAAPAAAAPAPRVRATVVSPTDGAAGRAASLDGTAAGDATGGAIFFGEDYVAHPNTQYPGVINVFRVAPLIKYYEMQFGVVLCADAVRFAVLLREATSIDFPPHVLLMCPTVFALLEYWDAFEFVDTWIRD